MWPLDCALEGWPCMAMQKWGPGGAKWLLGDRVGCDRLGRLLGNYVGYDRLGRLLGGCVGCVRLERTISDG